MTSSVSSAPRRSPSRPCESEAPVRLQPTSESIESPSGALSRRMGTSTVVATKVRQRGLSVIHRGLVLEHLTRIDEVRVGDAVLGHQGVHRGPESLGDGGEVVSGLHRVGAGGRGRLGGG